MVPNARSRSVLFSLAIGLGSVQTAPAVWASGAVAAEAAAPIATHDAQIIVKLRASLDAGALLSARLTTGSGGARAWRPTRLREPFAARAGRFKSTGREVDLERVYVTDVPRDMTVEEAIARLARDPRVDYVQRDYVRETHGAIYEPFYRSSGSWGQPYDDLWGLKKLNLEQAWDLARGDGVVVAVVDSGIDYSHLELVSQMWSNPEEQNGPGDNGYPGDVHGWDFVSNDNDPRDELGHGTHMAGIIAAQENGRGTVGVAPGARLMAVRAINGAGAGNSSTLAQGIVYAADNGANVIVVSSGCIVRCPSDPLVESAVRHATSRGAIVVVSAGNRGDDLAFYSPQNMTDPRPIVVAASTRLDQRASFGNYGERVDLVAPGGGDNVPPPAWEPVSNILSLASASCSPLVCHPQFLVGGGEYLRRQGTSMAAAHVAGVVALLLASDLFDNVDAVRERLFGNVDDLGPIGHDAMFGWGRLTGRNAVGDIRRYILARISSPATGQTVRGLVRIAGAAAARTFSHYEIAVGFGATPTSWQAAGITVAGRPTAQGDLARWNTDGLTAGVWTIRLIVYDTVGGRREYRRTVRVDDVPIPPQLVIDVASEGGGSGAVHIDPLRPFCDGASGSTQTCVYTEPAGTRVTLTALASGLSGFAGWSGACSGMGTCTVEISRLHNVRAAFRGPYRLVLRVNSIARGEGLILVSDSTPADGTCGDSCFLFRPSRVVSLALYEGPLSSVVFDTPPCVGRDCDVTMDRDQLIEATAQRFDSSDARWADGPRNQRAPLGPLTLTGFIGHVFPDTPVFPVTVSWFDINTGEFFGLSVAPFPGPAVEITVQLGLGVHTLAFMATDSADPVGNWQYHEFRVVVHEP